MRTGVVTVKLHQKHWQILTEITRFPDYFHSLKAYEMDAS